MARPPRRPTPPAANPPDPSTQRVTRAQNQPALGPAAGPNAVVLGRTSNDINRVGNAGTAVDPNLVAAILRDLAMPKPLMLLPIRLEYRVVQTRVPVVISAATKSLLARDTGVDIADSTDAVRTRLRAQRPRARAARTWTLAPSQMVLRTRQEIWFRWFPDDSFAQRGVAPATDVEQAALARFATASAGKPWTAIDDPSVLSAWQALSRELAPERALFLLRNPGGGDPNYLNVQGSMTLLPSVVVLFALDTTGAVTEIARGSAIDATLRYTPAALQDGGWLTDFGVAVKAGMGVRITVKASVDAALAASWVIAVGLSNGDAATDVQALVQDRIASGDFAFLPQDTATNNAPGQPSPYKPPSADLLAFLKEAVAVEGGVLASPLQQAAELFAEASGIDVNAVARAPGSADLAYEDARAMLRVIGPALIDTAVARTTAIQDIDEEEVVDMFAEAIMARGALPPVRFGKNPFGVLPVITTGTLESLASDSDHAQRIEKFIRDFATLMIGQSQRSADALVPVLQPGDPAASDKLETILKQNPVSRRLEVSTVGQSNAKALGCAYVDSPAHHATDYLLDLQRRSISALADPTEDDPSYPLLYRLARLSLTKCTLFKAFNAEAPHGEGTFSIRSELSGTQIETLNGVKTKFGDISLSALARTAPNRFDRSVAIVLQRTSAQFLDGLKRLQTLAAEPDGIAKLEMLLMETIDLFQHRIDAWATGIAYRRLVKRRRAGLKGLAGGCWGILGKLRPDTATGGTDGFLQAPSLNQAVTAAVLRSANLRHGGPFAIGLDSKSVRTGLDLLEFLQAGISPGEALGYLGERILHDRKQDTLIEWLRTRFPMRDPSNDTSLAVRLFDGLAFLARNLAGMGPPTVIGPLTQLQAILRDHFDALSDIVMAEAVHLRALGLADAANAWLQVLSGDTIPGLPSVLRTSRNGHASSHRVVALLKPAASAATSNPRAIAEPALADLAAQRIGTVFDQCVVRVSVARDGQAPLTRDYKLAADLGLQPIDLVIGGEAEIVLRARHRFSLDWRRDAAIQSALGPLPDRGIVAFMNGQRPVTLDLTVGAAPVTQRLATATAIRRITGQSRVLEPGDLSAAANPATPLTDAAERDLLVAGSAALAGRASALATRINSDLATLTNAFGTTVAAARELRRQRDLGVDATQLAILFAGLESLHQALDDALVKVSWFGEPGALSFLTTAELADDPDELERTLSDLIARLKAKAASLAAVAPPAAVPATAQNARAVRNGLTAALSSALDGDALKIFPPFPRVAETTPMLAAPGAVADALQDWTPARTRVRAAAMLFGGSGWQAWINTDAATGADDPDADARQDESLAPRARLFCNFLSQDDPATTATFVGLVADEWSERRPSRTQQTGLAINYDSPQSEAPQAILLCEPSGPAMGGWSPDAAAKMVAETIRLMKMRALSAQQRPLVGPLFRSANQVPFLVASGAVPKPRIPVRDYRFVAPLSAVAVDSSFLARTTDQNVGIVGAGFNEVSGFGKVKE